MARHHYVPVSILKKFLPDDPALLDWPNEKALQAERQRAQRDDSLRRRSVAVYDRPRARIVPRMLRDTMSTPDFYSLPPPRDAIHQGLIYYHYATLLGQDVPPHHGISPVEYFRHLASNVTDEFLQVVETVHTADLDSRFSRLAVALMESRLLAETDMGFLLDYLSFARARTPIFRATQFPAIAEAAIERGNRAIRSTRPSRREARELLDAGWTMEEFWAAPDNLLYQVTLVMHATGQLSPFRKHPIDVFVYHIPPHRSERYLVGDCPMHPFIVHDVRNPYWTVHTPGLRTRGAAQAFVLSPTCCILVCYGTTSYHRLIHEECGRRLVKAINTAQYVHSAETLVLPLPTLCPLLDRASLHVIPR